MSLTPKEAFAKLPQKLHNFFIKYPPRPFATYLEKPSTLGDPLLNPFLPNKNTESGKWHEPKYSLRRSADLYKMAYKFGLQDLLPPIPHKRFYEDKYNHRDWVRLVSTRKGTQKQLEAPAKRAARDEAVKNMNDIIIAARPGYKKQLKKQEKKKRTWF